MLIPSIDLFNGQAVQWRQGREHVLARDDVFDLLESFSLFGEVAVIDLNAATGKGNNGSLIEEMLKRHPCRVGGGIRDLETARHYLKVGATKIILGTAAREPWVRKLPKEALIFALDAKGDEWLSHGWKKNTGLNTLQVLEDLSPFCSEVLYTQVEKEGMMAGLDRPRITQLVNQSPIQVTVAGGVTTTDDVAFLHQLGAKAQIGMALYTGKLSLQDALLACLDFKKSSLIPTIVQDIASHQILMLAYSSPESLKLALSERKGIYFSRSRQELWRKGETSGNSQELCQVDWDCDGDSLIFKVRQKGPACHFSRYSCFSRVEPRFSLTSLDTVLEQRQKTLPEGSFTAKLFNSVDLQNEKLREETEELIEAENFADARWEAADLLYFTLVKARAMGVGLEDIVAELRSRHGNS